MLLAQANGKLIVTTWREVALAELGERHPKSTVISVTPPIKDTITCGSDHQAHKTPSTQATFPTLSMVENLKISKIGPSHL